jgi:hypothetical protein
MDDLFSLLNQSPKASIIESATKLALEWADQNKPLNEEEMSGAVERFFKCLERLVAEENDKAAQVAKVKATTRLALYWYGQNRSASLQDFTQALEKLSAGF